MGSKNEWLLLEAEDDIDEIEHRHPTEEFLFYQAVSGGGCGGGEEKLQGWKVLG